MSEEPDWAKVLRVIYHKNIDIPNTFEESISDESPLLTETGLEKSVVSKQLNFLIEVGLLTSESYSLSIPSETEEGYRHDTIFETEYVLSSKGFDVAHQRQMSQEKANREEQRTKRQNDVNRAIGILTFGLLFATFADTALNTYINSGISSGVITFGLALEALVIVGFGLLLLRTESLNFEN